MRVLPLVALALALAAARLPAPAGELSERDHKAIGESLAAYFAARDKGEGITDALASLNETLEKIEKKAKGRAALAMVEDLGQAFWLAEEYDQEKGVKKGRIDTYEAEVRPEWTFSYALHAPKKYDPRRGGYPLLLCIPDKGEKPEQHLIEDWVDNDLREEVILVAVGMPEDVARWSDRSSGGGAGQVLYTLSRVRRQYAIDFDRVFLAGSGAGVAAALEIASSSPDNFAGVIGRMGDVGEATGHENFSNLPSFFAGAGANATAFAEKLKKEAHENCTLAASAGEAEIRAWMQQQKRVANPPKVVLKTGSPYPNKAYWLSTPAVSGASSLIKATIDRESNTVTVEGTGVESVRLYFNDVLVDLDKPVKVVCNGAESTDLIPRNLSVLLDLYWNGACDPGRLYTAVRPYDMPAAQSQ
jgi:hypothetical protein